ncbi:MAG: hypothetical protein HY201_02085 [Nitrospirae bacterium]|nr:hypothetical protein [Candidatus Troglogloeales bacterium]MBI3598233.1 hypothetical protein [Candidatus Troglogloeales bacterium]
MSSTAYEQKKWVSKDQIQRVLSHDGHRAYSAEDVMKALKLASPKDPEKQAQVLEQIASCFIALKNEAVIREIAPNLLKMRLYFDKEKGIEHAYIGGMGNTLYCFNALIFRLNIGVLSILFVRNEEQKNWRVSVADPTIGKNYSLLKPLCDGVHVFGTAPSQVGDAASANGQIGWVIEGKYIDKTHTIITLSSDQVSVVDHRTLRGTRIDHLTETGFADYLIVAGKFLKSTDKPKDTVKRGRFALEQLLRHHENFELSFFNAAVDFLLLKESK